MSARGSSATNVVQLDAAGRRQAKIVAAARVVSIDYRSIVDNAVEGLTNNTPDARREVYAQARVIVKRHLQLMRLPEPIVEVEKLALDLTIRKIERQWRSRQAAEKAIPDPDEVPAEAKVERVTAGQALGLLAQGLATLGKALASLLIIVGLRPVLTALTVLTRPLRILISPVSLAAALPIIAMAIFFIFFVDNKIAYKSLIDGPAGRLLSRLDILPSVPAPRNRAKTPDRAPSALGPDTRRAQEGSQAGLQEGAQAGLQDAAQERAQQPARTAVADARAGASASAVPDRGPTRVRPVAIRLVPEPAPVPASPQGFAPTQVPAAPQVPPQTPAPVTRPLRCLAGRALR